MPVPMDTSQLHEPVEIRAPHGAQLMEIDFADGHIGHYPHDLLRGYCPCAACQGHQGEIRFVEAENLDLVEVGEVGNYALKLVWGDGHASGIYSFRFLRTLCSCNQCLRGDPRGRLFSR